MHGFKNKKLQIKYVLDQESICMQEIDIETNYDENLLSIPRFVYEQEMNDTNARVGISLQNSVDYERSSNLEGANSSLIIIDVEGGLK